ncbi:hypothetical protein [Bacteroides sp. 519]|uniref:hypothetical protein n=1 Tax=Bacteroides sp. 519 TaxID=2302937 RepID=UPI0013D6A47E|nr:hypothetical protein [Bacteroides sp. 519]NDV56964.1 hypothetical protein [Bacteroides sp. 519]
MKRILVSLTVIFCLCMVANAQQRYTWKQYGLSFSVPTNFKVLENTAESFEAENNNIHLAIEVIDYDGIDPEDLGTALGTMAVELKMKNSEIGELALTTLEGAFIEGEIDGVNVCLVLLCDTESNIALLSSITYADGFEQQATNIVNSFSIK